MNAHAFADVPEDTLARPRLDPRIFAEAKDRDSAPEIRRQSEFVNQMRKHAGRCIVWACPNSARTDREKLRQHREGAIYGAADLIVAWAGGVAFIEFKDGKSVPRNNQIDFLNTLARQDHHVCVGRTAAGVMAWLHSLGAPVPRGMA